MPTIDNILDNAGQFGNRPLADLSLLGILSPRSVTTLSRALPPALRAPIAVYAARMPLHTTLVELACVRGMDAPAAVEPASRWLSTHGPSFVGAVETPDPLTLKITGVTARGFAIRIDATLHVSTAFMARLYRASALAQATLQGVPGVGQRHPIVSRSIHISIAGRDPGGRGADGSSLARVDLPDNYEEGLVGMVLPIDSLQVALATVEPYAIEETFQAASRATRRYVQPPRPSDELQGEPPRIAETFQAAAQPTQRCLQLTRALGQIKRLVRAVELQRHVLLLTREELVELDLLEQVFDLERPSVRSVLLGKMADKSAESALTKVVVDVGIELPSGVRRNKVDVESIAQGYVDAANADSEEPQRQAMFTVERLVADAFPLPVRDMSPSQVHDYYTLLTETRQGRQMLGAVIEVERALATGDLDRLERAAAAVPENFWQQDFSGPGVWV